PPRPAAILVRPARARGPPLARSSRPRRPGGRGSRRPGAAGSHAVAVALRLARRGPLVRGRSGRAARRGRRRSRAPLPPGARPGAFLGGAVSGSLRRPPLVRALARDLGARGAG